MYSEAAFASINGVPVIGARFPHHEQALYEVQNLTEQVAHCINSGKQAMVQVGFSSREDGRFNLEVRNGGRDITVITGIDELMFHRFSKAYNAKKMFILTSFVDEEQGSPMSLVVSDGLGVVIYRPNEALQL